MVFSILQYIGGVILSVGWLPQIIRILRTRSVGDLSLRAYLLMLLGIALMEAYAIHLAAGGTGIAFLITNSMSLVVVSFMVFLVLKYRKNRSGSRIRDD